MTARDCLFAALDGRPVDRVPIWLLFPYHKVGYYTDVRTNPCYKSNGAAGHGLEAVDQAGGRAG
jgi:uroporphyrinogen-III decarboxylase